VSKDLKAGRLWDLWVRQGLLSQDRPRAESPLHHWKRSDPHITRQKRLNYMAAQVGTPSSTPAPHSAVFSRFSRGHPRALGGYGGGRIPTHLPAPAFQGEEGRGARPSSHLSGQPFPPTR
jgi:hypothetical protein